MNHRDATEANRVLFGITKAHKILNHFNANVELGSRKHVNNLLKWKYESPDLSEAILKDNAPEED